MCSTQRAVLVRGELREYVCKDERLSEDLKGKNQVGRLFRT